MLWCRFFSSRDLCSSAAVVILTTNQMKSTKRAYRTAYMRNPCMSKWRQMLTVSQYALGTFVEDLQRRRAHLFTCVVNSILSRSKASVCKWCGVTSAWRSNVISRSSSILQPAAANYEVSRQRLLHAPAPFCRRCEMPHGSNRTSRRAIDKLWYVLPLMRHSFASVLIYIRRDYLLSPSPNWTWLDSKD